MHAKKSIFQELKDSRREILRIVLAASVFLLAILALQYLPLIVKIFKIDDMKFGKAMVYSLPFFIGFAFFKIWKS